MANQYADSPKSQSFSEASCVLSVSRKFSGLMSLQPNPMRVRQCFSPVYNEAALTCTPAWQRTLDVLTLHL